MTATCLQNIDVVVLAGGLGTRLRPLVADRPKILAPIDGVPFLDLYLKWLSGFGARRIILSLGYLAEMVRDHVARIPSGGPEILVNVETAPLGTGGALRACLPLLKSPTTLVTNGDSLTGIDLCAFASFHKAKGARLSMAVTRRDHVGASGVVCTNNEDAVTAFDEKPEPNKSGYINAGIYLFSREALSRIPAESPVSLEKDVFPRLCGEGFYAMKGDFPFIDIGTPEAYHQASGFLKESIP